ncbi:MAG TPA: STAS/SEC14 domain-containing protein [Gemmataceae bacterium]|nr:STAS/SEC14 domain-containing protein [Gemmataceae bacterium]
MSVELREEAAGKVLIIKLSGKLTKQDYEHFHPEVESRITQHRKIRVLVEMHDFHGWTMGALWEDIKFDLKHFAHIERLALVGNAQWEAGMAAFCRPFTTAAIRFFYENKAEQAHQWITEGIAQPV